MTPGMVEGKVRLGYCLIGGPETCVLKVGHNGKSVGRGAGVRLFKLDENS